MAKRIMTMSGECKDCTTDLGIQCHHPNSGLAVRLVGSAMSGFEKLTVSHRVSDSLRSSRRVVEALMHPQNSSNVIE